MSAKHNIALATRRWAPALVLSALFAGAIPGQAGGETVSYVIEISVDGLGSQYLSGLVCGSQLPNFRRLQTEGAWTLNARDDFDDTTTLANHTTILTGLGLAGTAGHNWSSDVTPPSDVNLHTNKGSYVPGVFDVAHDNGLQTALFANKSKFILFRQSYDANNGAPNLSYGTNKIDTYVYDHYSAPLVDTFLGTMGSTPPNYSLLHLRGPDDAGHSYGWGSAAYNDSVKVVDAYLGSILNLVEANDTLRGKTAIILTADHGGDGTGHSTASERVNYTVPFFVWGPGVSPNADLYGLNPAARLDPGTAQTTYSDPVQPIRNGDGVNLALKLLGLGAIPGSTINPGQELVLEGNAPARVVIAYTAFNEPPAGAQDWTPGAGDTELGFSTTSSPQGEGSPLAATYDSTTSALRFRMRNCEGQTTFDPVDLRGFEHVAVGIDILIKDTSYEPNDYYRAILTNGVETVTLADVQGEALNLLDKGTFLRYSADIPAGWTTATLVLTSHTDSSSGAEAVDVDNVFFTGSAVPEPATLALVAIGSVLLARRRRRSPSSP
jgi:hypothetical protein